MFFDNKLLIEGQVLIQFTKFIESMKDLEYMINETLDIKSLSPSPKCYDLFFFFNLRNPVTHCITPQNFNQHQEKSEWKT